MNNNLEKLLNTHLIGNAAIRAIVGDRIFADIVEQGTPVPFVVYYVITHTPRSNFLDGSRNCTTDATVQIDCWSSDRLQVCNMRNIVCEAVHQMQESGDAMLAQVTNVLSSTENMGTDQVFKRSIECKIIYN